MTRGVLITGGTGTFGQAFVKRLLGLDVDRVVVFSRDEYKQAEMERGLREHPQFRRLRFYIGDVRDVSRLEMAMRGVNYVVHAAAMKRIEKCETDPIEAVATNIQGTANVIQAALRQPAMINVVGLSTDKACNPINLYGATKLTMERLLMAANNLSGGGPRFSVVRYGNIWGSRGSVVDLWRRMISDGAGYVSVTDTDATRFFMRIEDACDLVQRQMFNIDPPPFMLAKKMPAYRVGDLISAFGIGYDIIGLSPFEKLHEELYPGITSDRAERMTVEDLQRELAK